MKTMTEAQVTIGDKQYVIVDRIEPGPKTQADSPRLEAFITVRRTTGKTTYCALLFRDGSAKIV